MKMKAEELWCGLAAFCWVCALTGGHAPGNEWPDSVKAYTTLNGDERFTSDTYVTANINITYKDEDGELYTETSEAGKYGEGFVGSARGRAVHIRSLLDPKDHTGCTWPLLSTGPSTKLPSEPWIAVIRRGSCNFEVKVQNAWRANASAVLVYNDRDSPQLEKMKLNTENRRNISAVFTYRWKGEEIRRLVDNGTNVELAIIKGRNCIRTYNNINKTSVLFVSISFIVLMIISLAWLVFYYIQRFRYIHAKDRLSKRLCCAAKKAVSKIPVKCLKNEDKEVQGDGECCAVCIEPYKVSEMLRSLPCKHDFHKSCIDPWLLEHRTCPMCKMDILKYYGFVFTGSQESILQLEADEGRSRAVTPARSSRQVASDNSFEEAGSERSSRASSPDELTPSLRSPPAHTQPPLNPAPAASAEHSEARALTSALSKHSPARDAPH